MRHHDEDLELFGNDDKDEEPDEANDDDESDEDFGGMIDDFNQEETMEDMSSTAGTIATSSSSTAVPPGFLWEVCNEFPRLKKQRVCGCSKVDVRCLSKIARESKDLVRWRPGSKSGKK